ncbi:helix-turn-helix domain-containing protein [Gordoniibacillus kamchatkensis]|uniref:helix-turn-helix domain-containing protein n=1 Tax=Gordoniibacillus kamchatkensis TaxID=1590651 RepID=UPI001E3A95FA|nr:helix-turn-helix transcriptional regulator [Paenibacillus sp. VKM B-2647]
MRLNGKTLVVIRAILGLSQTDVGNLIGLTPMAISLLENGETKAMSAKNTARLIEALNLTPREFAAVQTAIRTVESKFNRGAVE